jgi:Cu/Ag efflux pump CusA
MLLVLAFGRVRDALIVMVNLPLALIGGVVGVFLSGGVLNGDVDRVHHAVRHWSWCGAIETHGFEVLAPRL